MVISYKNRVKRMKWSTIKSLSCCSTMGILHEDDPEQDYDVVFQLREGGEESLPNVVYFAATSQYLKLDGRSHAAFILYHDDKDKAFPQIDSGNVGAFVSMKAFESCIKALVVEFSIFHKLERGTQKIFELVAANSGMQTIIDFIAQLYDAPASIIDNSYTPIAWSQSVKPHTQRLWKLWNTLYPIGKMSDIALAKMKNTQIMHPVGKIEHTRKWENVFEDEVVSNYLTMIYVNNIAIASFSILYNDRTLSEVYLMFLPVIAKALSLEMQKSDFYILNKASYFTHIFVHLLTVGSQLALSDLEARLSLFGYSLKHTKYIIYADILDFTLHHNQLQAVAGSLQDLFSNSIYIIRDSGIIFLMSRDRDDILEEAHFSEWRETLYSMGLRVGISNPFENPSDVNRCLEQARRAIEIGCQRAPSECLFVFLDYQLSDMVFQLSKVTDLSVYLYPPLKWVVESDMRKKTNLTYTLYVYLKYSRRSAQVCSKLFIHKNTLYYRLDKIRSIMHVDIDDAQIDLQIILSFEIMKYRGEFDRLPK